MKDISFSRNVDISAAQDIKFLWIFFLILSNNKKNINKGLTLSYTNGFNLLLAFFKLFNFNYLYVSFSNWNKERLMHNLINFLISLYSISFNNNFLKHFFYSFKRLFNVFSIFFIPNFIFKKFDFIHINSTRLSVKKHKLFLGRNFFFFIMVKRT